ncbi:MAG: TIM barrel protein [Verrucomicrobia bacterium]|nr:TIM barrel protein [Verrucomicrobiota bacterium]
MAGRFRFSFGPWNISEGSDPFGPAVRRSISFNKKLALYRDLGFGAVQLHDDDAVPDIDKLAPAQIAKQAAALKRRLSDHGLVAEFVAPRLWEDPRTVDGAYTANSAAVRRYAQTRTRKTLDVAEALGTKLCVVWYAREGTYIREAKDSVVATQRLVAALDDMLAHHPTIRIAIEPKPNEPMDQAYIPTTGHGIALGQQTSDPSRIGINIESAHAILAGLDPSDEMGFALAMGKLWTVHLNDQNGLKFDQDKSFGSVDLRRAFNQVRILDRHNYGLQGEWVGLDVKTMRTQKPSVATKHLTNSRKMFARLLEISRGLSDKKIAALIADRDYEELDFYIMDQLTGGRSRR